MRDKELTLEVLCQIEDAAGRIISRFESIHSISPRNDQENDGRISVRQS